MIEFQDPRLDEALEAAAGGKRVSGGGPLAGDSGHLRRCNKARRPPPPRHVIAAYELDFFFLSGIIPLTFVGIGLNFCSVGRDARTLLHRRFSGFSRIPSLQRYL